MTTPRWIDRAARGIARWAQTHPDAAGPGGPGDSQATALAVAAVLWFCATLALGAILAGVTTVASGEEATQAADVDWRRFGIAMALWVTALNVPVWLLGWRRWRRGR